MDRPKIALRITALFCDRCACEMDATDMDVNVRGTAGLFIVRVRCRSLAGRVDIKAAGLVARGAALMNIRKRDAVEDQNQRQHQAK
ncbi:MAG: hypothetical protein U5K56_00575 [Halioglobus sp.]|nr:hypothetical protein [Halioglobus sp.]